MSKPKTLADLGVAALPAATPGQAVVARSHRRFADIRAFADGVMPVVERGQVWADLDPRCQGRTIEIIRVENGLARVKTLTPRTCAPRTASTRSRDTVGAISRIALRRFRPNSRGFRLITDPAELPGNAAAARQSRPTTVSTGTALVPAGTPAVASPPVVTIATGRGALTLDGGVPDPMKVDPQTFAVALLLANGANSSLSEMDLRAALALVALFGIDDALKYVTEPDAVALYATEGLTGLLYDATTTADEQGWTQEWADHEIASRDFVRRKCQ